MRSLFLILMLCVAPLCQASSEFKLPAKPGQHAVGMRVVHRYDYSRVYRARVDLDTGQPYTGERARPIQTIIWYPAASSGATPMVYEDYLRTIVTEEVFDRPAAELAAYAEAQMRGHGRHLAPEQAARMRASPMLAVRDASAVPGKFPVVVYAPSFNSSAMENADLCEFLASQGYVVMASPSMGARTREMTFDLEGLETQAADIAFLVAYAHTLPQADASHVAIAGFSWGGMANVFAAARDSRIKALVSLDGTVRYNPQLIADAKYVTAPRVAVPMLFIAEKPMTMETLATFGSPLNTSLLNDMRYADVYINTMYPMEHAHFSSVVLRMSKEDAFGDYTRDEVFQAYGWTLRYVGRFLDAYLKNDPAAKAFLANPPVKNGVPARMASMDVRLKKSDAPTFESFSAQLGERGFEQAHAIYLAMRKSDPTFALEKERINLWGYRLLAAGKDKEAIEIFKLNTLLNPGYGNGFDSLADAYEKVKMNELALENTRRALELDPQHVNAAKRLKTMGLAK